MNISRTDLKFNIDSLLAILFVSSCVIPYISFIGRGDTVFYAIYLLWFVSVIWRKGEIFRIIRTLSVRRMEMGLLFIFFLFALFNYLFVTTTPKAFQFTLMPVTYFLLLVMDAYYFNRAPQYRISIFFIAVIVMAVQAAISIPYTYGADEMVSRMYTSGELEGQQLEEALKHGVGSANMYAFLSGVFYMGIGLSRILDSKLNRLILMISLSLILMSIVSSTYSVSFTMLFCGALVFLLRADWRRIQAKYVFFVVFFVAGLVVFYNTVLEDSKLIEPIQRKINLIKTGNIREDGRLDLATVSLRTFMDHPFFGIGVPEWGLERRVGEHMPWIDFAAHYGSIGFFPFVMFIALLFKRNAKFFFRTPKQNIYATSCLAGYVIFVLANFIDPSVFENQMIVMLLFFYTSMSNWAPRNFQSVVIK